MRLSGAWVKLPERGQGGPRTIGPPVCWTLFHLQQSLLSCRRTCPRRRCLGRSSLGWRLSLGQRQEPLCGAGCGADPSAGSRRPLGEGEGTRPQTPLPRASRCSSRVPGAWNDARVPDSMSTPQSPRLLPTLPHVGTQSRPDPPAKLWPRRGERLSLLDSERRLFFRRKPNPCPFHLGQTCV